MSQSTLHIGNHQFIDIHDDAALGEYWFSILLKDLSEEKTTLKKEPVWFHACQTSSD